MGEFDRASKDRYTLGEIERTLRNKELMYIYASHGDMDSINQIVDAEIAVDMAEPTELQRTTIDLVWRQGNSLVKTGEILGVTPQAVKFNLELFKVKLKRVLNVWAHAERDYINDGN